MRLSWTTCYSRTTYLVTLWDMKNVTITRASSTDVMLSDAPRWRSMVIEVYESGCGCATRVLAGDLPMHAGLQLPNGRKRTAEADMACSTNRRHTTKRSSSSIYEFNVCGPPPSVAQTHTCPPILLAPVWQSRGLPVTSRARLRTGRFTSQWRLGHRGQDVDGLHCAVYSAVWTGRLQKPHASCIALHCDHNGCVQL